MNNSGERDSSVSKSTIYNAGIDGSTQQLNGKCGEIFVERICGSDVFSFTCVFCNKAIFTEVSEFFEHFKDFHTKSFVVDQELDPLELNNDENKKIIKIEDNIHQTDLVEGFNTVIIKSSELELKNETSNNYIGGNTISHRILSKMNKNDMDMETTESNIQPQFSLDPAIEKSVNSKQNDEKLCIRNDCNGEDDREFAIEKSNTKTLKTDENSGDKNSLENLNKYVRNNSNDSLMTTAKTDENKIFSCKICDRNYQLKSSLNRHMKNIHSLSECVSTELLSGNKVKDSYFKEFQKNVVAMTYTDPMKCRYCGRRMKGKSQRIEHERIHTGEKPFKCKYCDKHFRTSSTVKVHEQIHQGTRPHKCKICNAAFRSRSNLHQHIRRHGDKKLPCQYCGKLFQEKSDRTIHERTHTGEKPFQCSVCGKCFIKSDKLTLHTLRHTNDKRFKCTMCGKRFFSNSELREHNVSHNTERPFKCDICSATFPRRKSLKSHKKLHSEDNGYICTICGKGFKQSPGLSSHIKSHGIPIKSV